MATDFNDSKEAVVVEAAGEATISLRVMMSVTNVEDRDMGQRLSHRNTAGTASGTSSSGND